MKELTTFLAGLLFAIGLGIAGMTNPAKVIGFLDLTGDWDPSLALVMVGGIGTHMLLYRFIVNRPSPLVEDTFRIPTRRDLTPRLIAGSGLFGMGWALAGYCPGPALTSLGTASSTVAIFVVAMAAGMWAFGKVEDVVSKRQAAALEAKSPNLIKLERSTEN